MTQYYTTYHKTSDLIKYLAGLGYVISSDKNLYKQTNMDKIIDLVDSNEMVIVIKRKSSTEVIAPDNSGIDQDNTAGLVEFSRDDQDIMGDKHITSVVSDTMKRAGFNNPGLIRDLEAQSEDAIEDDVKPEELFVMEKKETSSEDYIR